MGSFMQCLSGAYKEIIGIQRETYVEYMQYIHNSKNTMLNTSVHIYDIYAYLCNSIGNIPGTACWVCRGSIDSQSGGHVASIGNLQGM